tara:strand:+ start:553 stop:864 length:312 start_codon:yes stop_codon:yes gene_type:complete
MTDIITAIIAINPKAEVSVNGEDYNQITWHNDTTPISEADIKAKQAELQTDYDNKEYQRKRAEEYLHVKEQLDQLYHDMTAGKLDATGEWYKTIKEVKEKYPK